MKILIFGLPGAGKTTFAQKLCKDLDVAYFNADQIRKIFNDWDFSDYGRTHQALRMQRLTELTNKSSIVDFICPFNEYRNYYDLIIWINTIDKSKFENTNKIFQIPNKVSYEIKDYNYNNIIKEIHDRLG